MASAEGAKQVLFCQASQICTDAGACQPSSAQITFTLTPLKAGGLYQIEYNNIKSEMQNVTGAGPFVWVEGNGNTQTLLAAGDKSVLWHRMNAGLPPTSTIQFLTCEDAS